MLFRSCKKFGHNCAATVNVPKPQTQASRPSSSYSKNNKEEGVWMVVSKGKSVIDHTHNCEPSTSFNENNLTAINTLEFEGYSQKGIISINNGVNLPAVGPLISAKTVSPDALKPTAMSPTTEDQFVCITSPVAETIVTKISDHHQYSRYPQRSGLLQTNQFDMLGEVLATSNEDEGVEDLDTQDGRLPTRLPHSSHDTITNKKGSSPVSLPSQDATSTLVSMTSSSDLNTIPISKNNLDDREAIQALKNSQSTMPNDN